LLSFFVLFSQGSLSHELFKDFLVKYNVQYESANEYKERYQIFTQNLAIIESLMKREYENNGKAIFGITKFADWSPAEFQEKLLLKRESTARRKYLPVKLVNQVVDEVLNSGSQKTAKKNLPESFDWRDKGAVTPVYNQEQCGSCYAFSSVETVESYWFLQGHNMTELSVQQIVDCDKATYGCGGGWTYDVFDYIIQYGGLMSAKDYPYTGLDEQCKFDRSKVVAKINKWEYVSETQDEDEMAAWIAETSPVSVCLDAVSWQFYESGIIMPINCGPVMDHCVQVTGYGIQEDLPVWNVRNTWGLDWGIDGYAYLLRGNNTCGIALLPLAVS